MKHLMLLVVMILSICAYADAFFGPVVPRSTVRTIINQAVKESKAYTDSVLTNDSASADTVALSNRIEQVNARFVNYLTTQGAYDAYQPKGDYLTEHQDISGKANVGDSFTKAESDERYLDDIKTALEKIKLLEALLPDDTIGLISEGEVNYSDPTKNLALAGDISGSSVIVVNELKAKNLNGSASPTNGAAIDVTANAVSLKFSNLEGTTQEHHELIRVKDAESMIVEGVTFTGDTYNTIMTGQQSTKFLKNLTIKDCTFDENCKHINVWFAGFQDGAVLTIKNCTFKTCEQFLCISDYQGTVPANTLTVNLENVTIANYETGTAQSPDVYEGIILCDDRKCTSAAQLRTVNPFSKVTINIKNVTVKGTKLTQDNFVMGSGTVGQMLYYYSKNAGGVYPMNSENASLFPTINVIE